MDAKLFDSTIGPGRRSSGIFNFDVLNNDEYQVCALTSADVQSIGNGTNRKISFEIALHFSP